jgi:hypothetical protein
MPPAAGGGLIDHDALWSILDGKVAALHKTDAKSLEIAGRNAADPDVHQGRSHGLQQLEA